MPAAIGRSLLLKKATVVLAGLQAKTVTVNASPIDITNDDSLGFRTLLSTAGEKSIDISFNGIATGEVIFDIITSSSMTSCMLSDITITNSQGSVIAGNFFLDSYEETGAYNDKVTFSGTLKSSGAFTIT